MRLLSGSIMLLALGAVLFASATPAAAATIAQVSGAERKGHDKPLLFDDMNFSLESQIINIGGVNREVIVGFVDFQAIIGSTESVNAANPIKDAGFTGTGTGIGVSTSNNYLSGWFVAMVIGTSTSTPEGASLNSAYFGPVPVGTMVTLTRINPDTTITTKSVKWDPEGGAGTIFDLYEDSTADLDTADSIAAYNTIVGTGGGGTDASAMYSASVGFNGTATNGATYAAGDEYFANIWFGAISGKADLVYGSLNILGTPAAPFHAVAPNDTGNEVYLQGSLNASTTQWFATGDVDAKILLVPLPGAAWGGLALLGLLGVGRSLRRRKLD